MQQQLDALRRQVQSALDRWETAVEALRAAPTSDFERRKNEADTAEADYRLAAERLQRAERVKDARAGLPVDLTGSVRVGKEPLTYERHDGGKSYFGDLARAHLGLAGAPQAWDRLNRHRQEMDVEVGDVERRDLSSTDGQGGDFIAPLWIMEEFVALARAGRPFANAVRRLPLPPNTDSINVPKVKSGTATATQADLGAVQVTDATTDFIQTPVITIAGQQDVSRQAVDRSVPGLDEILLGDLAADYATQLDVQCLSGSGKGSNATGVLTVKGVNGSTYTDGSPTVPELYPKAADVVQQIHTTRFLSPQAWVMHPRRWGWFMAALDTTGRPLITPYAPQNAAGLVERVGAENVVGALQGLPVILDASVPTTDGAGTDEDVIIGVRLDDQYLWEEGEPNRATYFEVLSANLEVRFQVWGYAAFCAERYPSSIGVISGTGLATPKF
jgi:HK97 family phage major capsid protein